MIAERIGGINVQTRPIPHGCFIPSSLSEATLGT